MTDVLLTGISRNAGKIAEPNVRKLLAASLCCCLNFSAVLAAAADVQGSKLSTNPKAGAAVIASAVDRQFARETESTRVRALRQARAVQPASRSWIARHPALSGAMIGAAGGGIAGATVGHPSTTDFGKEFGRSGMVLLGAGVGAGIGSLVGYLVAAAKD
jgi:hypothetical protein